LEAETESCKFPQLPAKSCKLLQVPGRQIDKIMGRQNHPVAAKVYVADDGGSWRVVKDEEEDEDDCSAPPHTLEKKRRKVEWSVNTGVFAKKSVEFPSGAT
jgi:hypothetical protein